MGKKIQTKIGDVFCMEIDNKYKIYFQYVAKDYAILNSSLIKVFKTRYEITKELMIEDIVGDEVLFFAHTILKVGLSYGAWYKVGNSFVMNHDNIDNVIFGITMDTYVDENLQILSINPTMNWRIWSIKNKDMERVGILPFFVKNRVEIGTVVTFIDIIARIKYGYYQSTMFEYCDIKRIPFPYVHSYVRQDMDGTEYYYHFLGEKAIEQLVVKDGINIRLTKESPKVEGYALRTADFGDTNWKYKEFITKEEFEETWNA